MGWTTRVQFPAGDLMELPPHRVQTGSRTRPAFCPMGTLIRMATVLAAVCNANKVTVSGGARSGRDIGRAWIYVRTAWRVFITRV